MVCGNYQVDLRKSLHDLHEYYRKLATHVMSFVSLPLDLMKLLLSYSVVEDAEITITLNERYIPPIVTVKPNFQFFHTPSTASMKHQSSTDEANFSAGVETREGNLPASRVWNSCLQCKNSKKRKYFHKKYRRRNSCKYCKKRDEHCKIVVHWSKFIEQNILMFICKIIEHKYGKLS